MRNRVLILSTLLLAGSLAPAPAVAQDEEGEGEAAELFASENMRYVDTLAYELAYPDVEALPHGTDIEFADLVAGGEVSVERLAGRGRVQTAVEVSRASFDSADAVVIATGGVFADALAAAPLATSLGAPVLLSTADVLSPETLAEVERLGASTAILMGGVDALSADVADALADAGLDVRRIGGPNRFATAALITEEVGVDGEVLLAEGQRSDPDEGWQAALGASALGAVHRIPLLLVTADRLPEETAALLADDVDVVLAGSESDVTPDVAEQVDERTGTVTRIGGPTVYATSAALTAESIRRGADGRTVFVATGEVFPDGLVSGAAVGAAGGVLYLVDGDDLAGSPETRDAIADAAPHRVTISGGVDAISAVAGDALADLAAAQAEPSPYAIAGTYMNGLQIVDIADPEDAAVVSTYDCGVLQGDVQIFTRDGRTYATYTSEDTTSIVWRSDCVADAVAAGDIAFADDDGDGEPDDLSPAYGTYIADITDPLRPTYGGFIAVPEGSHNGTVHPSGEWFYNSDSALITDVTPQIQIYDLRDLDDITRVGTVDLPVRPGLGTSSHDITFNANGTRMYSAALSQTVIFDTTDPAAPVEVSSFVDPAINVEHQADPVTVTNSAGEQRELLIVEDELAGAAGNGFCPGGGMHVYDVTGDNELNPALNKVGTYFIPEFRPAGTGSGQGEAITCTSHVFRIYPEQQIITIAWYNAGVWVLDISGLADAATSPVSQPIETLGYAYFEDSDTWSFKTDRFDEDGSFYGYGNDIARGLDIFRFDATAEPADAGAFQGRWVDQATAVGIAQRTAAAAGFTQADAILPRCVILGEASAPGT
ncbi:cell wall-binding repeat-containing protein [Euzebya sp.]|uniref:cell wall-binding repeat-containing protein n=1 Tax=Euzebya sp. TaxID=1971409 RepID=UPI0035157EA3